MKFRTDIIGEAMERLHLPVAAPLDPLLLTAAEKLRIAERLVEDVLASLSPMTNGAMCVAEGKLQVAADAVESAREIVMQWDDEDLPVLP